MRFILFALLTALLVFPSFVKAQKIEDVGPISFKMESVKGFAMRGSFEGEYRILPGSIELKITEGSIFLADNTLYRGSRMLKNMTFSLAELTKNGRRFQLIKTSQSKPLDITKVMRPLDTYNFADTYVFSIPIDETTDLSKVWIVAKMNIDNLELLEGKMAKSGYTLAHTCQNVFTAEYTANSCKNRF